MSRLLCAALAVLLCLGLLAAPAGAAGEPALAQRLASGEYVLLMRHADAPGTGDPPGYSLSDCASQRNLGERGRRQAAAIGRWLRAQGVTRAAVYSSAWCRCQDTARALALGGWRVEPALGSFFDTPGQAASQARALSQLLARELPGLGGRPLILVTHHVNILQFVGENIGSGEMVLVRVGPQGQSLGHVRLAAPV